MILLDPTVTIPGETSPPLPDGHLDFWNEDSGGDDNDDDDPTMKGRWRILRRTFPLLPTSKTLALARLGACPGPFHPIAVPPSSQTPSRILSKLLPREALPPPSGYEQIGHVIHLNLKRHHLPHGELIGSVLLDRTSGCRTVVNKDGEVGGPFRTYPMALLAGDPSTQVAVTEHGVKLCFDLEKVYWCTRLSGERTRMLDDDFRAGQFVADAFCGAGALVVRAASGKGCRVEANDLNPDAVRYCAENARRNGVEKTKVGKGKGRGSGRFDVECGDARDFISRLGLATATGGVVAKEETEESEGAKQSNERDGSHRRGEQHSSLPDHLVLNFPLAAPDFLGALRWWSPSAFESGGGTRTSASRTRVHVYTFARGDDPKRDAAATAAHSDSNHMGGDAGCDPRSPPEVAVDQVANGLLPESSDSSPTRRRWGYLDSLGCDVNSREVRDVAPGKVVVCVSFDVTADLLRRMQGGYSCVGPSGQP